MTQVVKCAVVVVITHWLAAASNAGVINHATGSACSFGFKIRILDGSLVDQFSLGAFADVDYDNATGDLYAITNTGLHRRATECTITTLNSLPYSSGFRFSVNSHANVPEPGSLTPLAVACLIIVRNRSCNDL